jgi:nucleoside-diphosphate-sugar epimerase
MHAGRPGVTYNVCSGRAYAISELVDGLRARVRVKVRLEVKQDLLRRNDTPLLLGSPARLQADTGWSPAISFDQMLDDLLDHWRDEVRPPA